MQKGKGHSRNCTTLSVANVTPRRLERQTPKCLWLAKARSCDMAVKKIFLREVQHDYSQLIYALPDVLQYWHESSLA